MKRWLYAHEMVPITPAAAREVLLGRTRRLLQHATGAAEDPPGGDGSFLIEVPAPLPGRELARQVRVHVDAARHSGDRVILPLRWRAASASGLFPTFEGALELEPLDDRRVQLSLVGAAKPPFGPLGATADAVALRSVADRTATRLVRRIAQAIEDLADSDGEELVPRLDQPLRVADVMTSEPLTVLPDTPLRTAALLMFNADISGLPVVDDDGALVGVLSERDLLAHEAEERFSLGRGAAAEARRREARTAGEACTRPALVTAPDTSLAAAARELLDRGVSRLVVLDGGTVAGILTRHDVLAAFVRDDADIAAAVRHACAAVGGDDLDVTVQWGEVTLAGRVQLRSLADRLANAAKAVDGVIAVDDGALLWDIDDVTPVSVPLV